MTAAQVSADGATFRVGDRIALFHVDERAIQVTTNWAPYDVSADGRFLMHQLDIDEATLTRLILVDNWVEELNRRVPN